MHYTHEYYEFRMLIISLLTISDSSGLLVATNKVKAAKALLSIIGVESCFNSALFCSKKYMKHAAAMRLLPSTKE